MERFNSKLAAELVEHFTKVAQPQPATPAPAPASPLSNIMRSGALGALPSIAARRAQPQPAPASTPRGPMLKEPTGDYSQLATWKRSPMASMGLIGRLVAGPGRPVLTPAGQQMASQARTTLQQQQQQALASRKARGHQDYEAAVRRAGERYKYTPPAE